ncbi:hypothetical protein [Staphylococcus saprophyticus]|uniref:hypothetical protein n=1 Tax=Staphylococcus saprophyticus TaxID=29385 RepID=UPI001244D20A|nr:hypothetical protein [Staphylococcus saprophyticus]
MEELGNLWDDNKNCKDIRISESKNRGDFIKRVGQEGEEIGEDEDIYGCVMIGEGILECE